jgi:MYXO-CTERM domain-containing protein
MAGFLHTPGTLALDGERHAIVGTELPLDTEYGIQPIGGLVRVDLDSGEQTLLFGDDGFQAGGEQFATVVLLPEPSTTAQGLLALATLLLLASRRRRHPLHPPTRDRISARVGYTSRALTRRTAWLPCSPSSRSPSPSPSSAP